MSDEQKIRRDSRATRRRRTVVLTCVLAVLAIGALGAGALSGAAGSVNSAAAPATPTPTPTPTPTATARPVPTQSATPVPVPTFDKSARSIDDPASIWVVVDKLRPLNPVDYVPTDLVTVPVPHTWEPLMRREASDALVIMVAAAKSESGLSIASNSAYRSYTTQVSLYDKDVAEHGQAAADLSTARPGTSEHQTGLTVDLGPESGQCSLNTCFADTAEGIWLADNAWRFGYLLRYPADKVAVTGYEFEPWHFRYVGVPLSTEMHNTGVTTLEEFFGLPAAPNYG